MRLISPDFLREIRRKALRKRIWFSAIDVIERGMVNLTIYCVEKIESLILFRILMNICNKINQASKSILTLSLEEYGFERAVSVVKVAIGFGARTSFWISWCISKISHAVTGA